MRTGQPRVRHAFAYILVDFSNFQKMIVKSLHFAMDLMELHEKAGMGRRTDGRTRGRRNGRTNLPSDGEISYHVVSKCVCRCSSCFGCIWPSLAVHGCSWLYLAVSHLRQRSTAEPNPQNPLSENDWCPWVYLVVFVCIWLCLTRCEAAAEASVEGEAEASAEGG